MKSLTLLKALSLVGLITVPSLVSRAGVVEELGLDPIVSETPIIGVVGDSLSDEYTTYPYGFSELNWTLLLEQTGYGELGDFQSFRLDTRLYGYEYNWARAGSQTSHVLNEGQVIGLGLQILDGDIEVAVVLIGANDFGAVYDKIYNSEWNQSEITNFMDGLKSNLKEIIETLRIANPPILIVCTIPDLGDTPNYRFGDRPDANKRALVTEYIKEANTYISELAAQNEAALIDAFAWFKDMVAEEEVRVMGYRMNSTTSGDDASNMFSIDGFHPGTLTQSRLANMILTTIEEERVRLVNEQIEAYNTKHEAVTTEPPFVAISPITAGYREIPNNVLFPLLDINPSADLFFPESRFTDASHNVILSPWFGVLATNNYPWINHQEHGWLYCDGYGGSVWVRMWDSNLGWLHTKPSAYPIFIQVSNGHAIRYELGSKEPRRFFDLETQSWIEIPYGAAILSEE